MELIYCHVESLIQPSKNLHNTDRNRKPKMKDRRHGSLRPTTLIKKERERLSSAGRLLCASVLLYGELYLYCYFMMSTKNETVDADEVCASCGIAGVDDIKLKDCDDDCGLVKYCSDGCQNNHSEQHKEECRKRRTELRDKDLFTMPEGSHLGECPICCLPLPVSVSNLFMPCCSKTICMGCHYANTAREDEAGLQRRCAFCRELAPYSDEECDKHIMKRIKENNDPAAMNHMGKQLYHEGVYETALKYLTKAAELGDADAHYVLSIMYDKGHGVEKDTEKEIYHLEEAAIAGHPNARNNLGYIEVKNGRFDRARKHWIIAANLGDHDSLSNLKILYADGHASKEDYAAALAAVDATKSEEGEKAEKAIKNGEIRCAF